MEGGEQLGRRWRWNLPPLGPWAVGRKDRAGGSRGPPLQVTPLPGCTGVLWLLVLPRCMGRAQV